MFVVCSFLLAAVALPGSDDQDQRTQSKADPKTAGQRAPGMVVSVDPVTRQVRLPTAAEAATLAPAPAAVFQAPSPVAIQAVGGGVGMKLGSEMAVHSVAVRAQDGKIASDCVTGDKAAAERVAKGATGTKDKPEH